METAPVLRQSPAPPACQSFLYSTKQQLEVILELNCLYTKAFESTLMSDGESSAPRRIPPLCSPTSSSLPLPRAPLDVMWWSAVRGGHLLSDSSGRTGVAAGGGVCVCVCVCVRWSHACMQCGWAGPCVGCVSVCVCVWCV